MKAENPIEEKIKKILDGQINKRSQSPWSATTNLIESGLLDSMSFMRVLREIESEFQILIDLIEQDPETLTSLNGLSQYVQNKMGAKHEESA